MDTVQDLDDAAVSGGQQVLIALIVGFLCLALVLAKIFTNRDASQSQDRKQRAGNPNGNSTKKHPPSEKPKEKPKTTQPKVKKFKEQEKDKDKDKEVKDPWLFTTLKGHTGTISSMDYSSNGKYMATCADDRTVLLWDVREIVDKERKSCKSFRVNLDGDSADLVRWSPDSRAFVVHRAMDNSCQVYRVEKKDGGGFVTTPTKTFGTSENNNLVAVSIAPDGKFILTATDNSILTIWDLKGPKEITRIDTELESITFATISPCGQFVAACGAEAIVWTNSRKEVGTLKKTFHLKQVAHLSFDRNGTKLATVSSTGDWNLYDIPPEIHARVPILQASGNVPVDSTPPLICLSPQGETLVVAASNAIHFYKIYRPNEPAELHRSISVYAPISRMIFDPEGKRLFLVCNDRHIKVFVNATKYASEMDLASAKLKEPQTSATRERLAQLVQDCQQRLVELCPQ